MNIAYAGGFLCDGLRQAGHKVFNLPPGKPVREAIKQFPVPIDLVFLELYGAFFPVGNIDGCEQETVAWCIDSPINEFWLKDACALFDHVFVDQKTTVGAFAGEDIKAAWLPLCCQDWYFTEAREKVHDITFIGTIDEHRRKRANLVRWLSRALKVNVARGVDMREAREIFARSKIVLNENLFPGLTLRILQGLASGSLVATEEQCADGFFTDGTELLEYNSDNVLDKLGEALGCEARREEMARNGQETCLRHHSSIARALQAIEAIATGQARNCRQNPEEANWRKLRASLMFTLRFGGTLQPLIREFCRVARTDSPHAPEAAMRVGDIFLNNRNAAMAEKYYRLAMSGDHRAFTRMAMLYLAEDEVQKAKACMKLAVKRIPAQDGFEPPALLKDDVARILYTAARIHFWEGEIFDHGFQKSYEDMVAGTAFEASQRLWQHDPSPVAMEMMLQALSGYGLEGELLPDLLEAVRAGLLTRRQALKAADLALKYYDIESADSIVSLLNPA